jgi:peptidoglycan/xylan/chitin deacetylase (PgdA/CDA1 family)
MYHSVSVAGVRDDLTVDSRRLAAQFAALRSGGYTTLSFSDLLDLAARKAPLPPRAVLVTFDDGFQDNLDVAYPLALEYGIKINLFVVPTFLIKGVYRGQPCIDPGGLSSMDPRFVEFGLHSFAHESYGDMDFRQTADDILRCKYFMETEGIPYQPCLAYPYGAYPRDAGAMDALGALGIKMAFRIGNRLNPWPLQDPYLVQRMDIRGTDPAWAFRAGLHVGRKWLPV